MPILKTGVSEGTRPGSGGRPGPPNDLAETVTRYSRMEPGRRWEGGGNGAMALNPITGTKLAHPSPLKWSETAFPN
jgi:hypothetical protein